MLKGEIIKWLICCVVMCGLAGTLWAMGGKEEAEGRGQKAETKSESAKEKSKKIVEPVLVWEKSFDEEIVDVIFGEAEMTVAKARALGMKGLEQKKITEKVNVQYPKVVVTKKGIKFLDKRGKTKAKKSLKFVPNNPIMSARIRMSENRKYMGIYTPIEVDKRTREVVKSKFTLMNDKGEILWKQDNIDPIFISNTGKNYVSIQHFEDPNLYFYDAKGTLLTKVTPIKKIDIFPGCGGGSFSHNGEFFLILTQYPSVLICYTKAGKEIWRHNLADWGGAMRISPNDTYIGAVAIKQGNSGFIYLFDIKGNLKWRKKIPPIGNWNIAFSPESSYLGIAGSQIYTFETATGKRVWKYKDAPSIIFKSISISSNGEYILASAVTYNPHRDEKGRVLSSPPPHGPRYIYLFNKKGNKIWKKDVSGKSYKNWEECPNISISKDGKEITIGVGNTLLYYKVF